MYVSNINYPYNAQWDVNNRFMTFDLEDVDNTYANAIRRIILSDIKSIGFKTRPYNESDINVIVNETTMDNQKLTHRIGLVPICITHPENFDFDDYQFYIDKTNTGNDMVEVTSADFKIKKLSKNEVLSSEDTNKFFPPNPITNEHFLICYLTPDKTGTGESGGKLHFTAKASLKMARDDAKFNVAQTSFKNKRDPVKIKEGFKEYIKENPGISKELAEKRYDITDADRYFHTDEYGHPNKFEFFIESYNVIPPSVVLYKALNILSTKLKNFINNLKTGNYNAVDIYPSETYMDAFDISIHNETHTLAALLQSYLWFYYCEIKKVVSYVGYIKPHPLQNNILLRIALVEGQNSKENVIKVLDKCVEQLLKVNNKIISEVVKIKEVSTYLTKEKKMTKSEDTDEKPKSKSKALMKSLDVDLEKSE